jgi:hypothetical protein
VIALLVAVALQGVTPDQAGSVQLGVAVRPETVTVGTRFIVVARLRAPLGATIAWPAAPDTSETVEIVSSRMVDTASDSLSTEETARWRLAAWDTGTITIVFEDAVVTAPDIERRVPLRARVYIRSVLPADTAQHVPKPTRDIFAARPPWWRWTLVGALALALVSLLLWWYLRRRKRTPPPKSIDAMQYAEREFARVERMGLIEAGERGRFVALMVEVVRDYLALRLRGALPAFTSSELIRFLRSHRDLPVQRLGSLLAEADLVKFARRPVTAERAREIGQEARTIVREVEKKTARDRAVAAGGQRAA